MDMRHCANIRKGRNREYRAVRITAKTSKREKNIQEKVVIALKK